MVMVRTKELSSCGVDGDGTPPEGAPAALLSAIFALKSVWSDSVGFKAFHNGPSLQFASVCACVRA